MAFLYGDPATTPHAVAGAVEVVDVPARTVLARRDRRGRANASRTWRPGSTYAEAPGSALRITGELRTMGYNSPMVSRDRRYFEVQLPVEPRAL